MKVNSKVTNALAQIGLVLAVILVIVVVTYSSYAERMEDRIQLKSRYTFTIRIDEEGKLVQSTDENILMDEYLMNSEESVYANTDAKDPLTKVGIDTIGDMWIKEYLAQYTQKFLSSTKSLRKIEIDKTTVLKESDNTVLISFSAKLVDSTTEYFSSWEGILDDGRLHCEWVVTYGVAEHSDGTATVYVESMLTPEDYGIYQYNESMKQEGAEDEESSDSSLTGYVIRDSALYVTYDGGETYKAVPVSHTNLFTEQENNTVLKAGSYMISTTKTAFMYGGSSKSGENVPVTLLYTDNMGEEWVTCEIDDIYTADYMYVEFFDVNVGFIMLGYDRSEAYESGRIYSTVDGGLTWNAVSSGPATGIIKGARFIDESHGFVCYEYMDGMDGNMYLTRDGGKTFSKIMFEAQTLDSSLVETGYTWNQVFNEAQVPKRNEDGILTVNVTQGKEKIINGGKTVARYQSNDKGSTWKYIGQFEINTSGT